MLLLRPLDVPTGKAIGVGLLWYGMTLVVSLLGAPAFAVGQRHDHEQASVDDDVTPTEGSETARAHHERRRRGPCPTNHPGRRSSYRCTGGCPAVAPCATVDRLYWWGEIAGGPDLLRRLLVRAEPAPRQRARGLRSTRRTSSTAEGARHQPRAGDPGVGAAAHAAFIIAATTSTARCTSSSPAASMIYLYRRWTDDYPRWRNTLGIATALALIGFAFFPLLPPRLLAYAYTRSTTGSSTPWPRTPRSGRSTPAR